MSGRPEALHVERYGETSAAGGDRLVLVHGFTQTGRSWRSVAAALAAGHDVVTVDLPGHGGSGAVHADLPRGGRLLGEAGGEATYIGYSLGARVVLHLALARPSQVTRMVLLGGTAGIDDPGERAERRASDERLDEAFNEVYQRILEFMRAGSTHIADGAHLLFIAKNIERIGDHATNVAEAVHFMVTGDALTAERPKGTAYSSEPSSSE